MKKLIFTMLAFALIVGAKANPIGEELDLSEVCFDQNGNWVIELRYLNLYSEYFPFDSIWIKTTSGISKIKQIRSYDSNYLLLIRNDSLSSNLTINPVKDSIQLIHSYMNYKYTDALLVYGDLPGSTVLTPRLGQSIAEHLFHYELGQYRSYSLDKSPTIGAVNDTTGMCGTLRGLIYDQNGHLFTETKGYFLKENFRLYPRSDGSYSIRVLANRNNFSTMYYNYTAADTKDIRITPIDVILRPDSVVTADIHLLNLINGVDPVKATAETVWKLSPNPLSGTTLNYTISLPVKSSDCRVNLINLSGQRLTQFSLTDNQGSLAIPPSVENGTYLFELVVNGKTTCTSKMTFSR